jgi:hypothetical protein
MVKQGICTDNNGTQPVFSGAASQLSCLQGIVDRCGSQLTFGRSDLGGETVSSLTAAFDSGHCDAFTNDPTREQAACMRAGNMDDCVANLLISEGANQQNATSTVVLDSNCNPARPDENHSLCNDGGIGVVYWPSPISLIWNAKADLNDGVRIVRFPLDPHFPEGFYLWKASNDFPLLVFDPSHSGQITKASQLFGNYTFGKQWINGYAALASLDANGDGKLSGDELSSLGLWFNSNRNGVSEPGEVRSLAELAVDEIYVTPSNRDQRSHDLYAAKGYAVQVSQDRSVGGSVDWYSKAYESEMGAIAALQELALSLSKDGPSSKVDRAETVRRQAKSSIDGAWFWTAGGTKLSSPKGVLTFKQIGEQITGRTYIEVPLKRNSAGFRSRVIASPFTGTIVTMADGAKKLHFEMEQAGAPETVSDAVVSADGRSLEGFSRSSVSSRKENSKLASLSYSWSAKRWHN